VLTYAASLSGKEVREEALLEEFVNHKDEDT
jgi:hypothetical protein